MNKYKTQSGLVIFLRISKEHGVVLSPQTFEWLKGEDWNQIKPFVEQEVSRFPEFAQKWFLFLDSREDKSDDYYKASFVLFTVYTIRQKLMDCVIAHSPDINSYWEAVKNASRRP